MILSFLHALPNDPHLPTSPYMEIEMGGGVAGGYVDNGVCIYCCTKQPRSCNYILQSNLVRLNFPLIALFQSDYFPVTEFHRLG